MIDLHCHVLPGVDDGALDIDESADAIDRMYRQGIRGIVVSPHVASSALFRMEEREAIEQRLADAWAALQALRDRSFPDLRLHRGTELMLDHPSPDLNPDWLRLGGTRFVLVEFLGMMIPPRAGDVLAGLVRGGYVPVIAHPERYRNAAPDCGEARAWRESGARLQVNCGSLLGGYGPDAEKRAWSLLQSGSADYLASDYHTRGTYPLGESARALERVGASPQFALLFSTNPARLLDGQDPLDVPPTDPRLSAWKRIVRRGRFW